MPAFIAFDSEKGGTGKSFAARSCVAWCLERKVPVAVIDADEKNPDVARWLQNHNRIHVERLTGSLTLRNEGGWGAISEIAERMLPEIGKRGAIILNCPANASSPFPDDRLTMFQALQAVGFATTLTWVLDTGDDVVNLLGDGFGYRRGKSAGHPTGDPVNKYLAGRVVLRNLIWGNHDDFRFWERSAMRKRFLQVGREDDFPRLWPKLAEIVKMSGGPNALRQHDPKVMGKYDFFTLVPWVLAADRLWDGLRPTLHLAA